MSEGADSFNATGPTVVAFETTSVPKPLQAFGVSVTGTTCGVYGQGLELPLDRRQTPKGIGAYGLGDAVGIIGQSSVTPDTAQVPNGRTGVFGLADDTGVWGRSPQIGVYGQGLRPGTDLHPVDPVAGTGVVGVGDAGGVVGQTATGTGVLGETQSGKGVAGDALGAGTGVFGRSVTGRAGIFTTKRSAQIQLTPLELAPGVEVPAGGVKEITVLLPKDGIVGDLITVVAPKPFDDNCALFLCSRSGSGSASAQWRRVLLDQPIEGLG